MSKMRKDIQVIATEEDSVKRPEQELWRAVIFQALRDFCDISLGKLKESESYSLGGLANWFFINNQDFNSVCLMANLEPDAIRRIASKVLWRGKVNNRNNKVVIRKKKRKI